MEGHEDFSGQSRGKQSFISLSALLTAQTIPFMEWNSTIMDNVLVQGDNMYLNAFNYDLIPREGFLSLNNLPTVVCCRWLEDKSNNSCIETCRSVIDTNLPIVVEPVEVQTKYIDLPIVVEPVEIQTNIDLPIVVEAQTKYILIV